MSRVCVRCESHKEQDKFGVLIGRKAGVCLSCESPLRQGRRCDGAYSLRSANCRPTPYQRRNPMTNPPTDEQMRIEALKADLRDRLTNRLKADVRHLMSEAGGYPLDRQDIREIVSEAAQDVNILVKRGVL